MPPAPGTASFVTFLASALAAGDSSVARLASCALTHATEYLLAAMSSSLPACLAHSPGQVWHCCVDGHDEIGTFQLSFDNAIWLLVSQSRLVPKLLSDLDRSHDRRPKSSRGTSKAKDYYLTYKCPLFILLIFLAGR